MASSLKESCGVVGVYAPGEEVARVAFFGLFALQHRGQESAGIASADGDRLYVHTSLGLVNTAFREADLEVLPGHIAIGHTRYSTTGSTRLSNAQPIMVSHGQLELALGHNGNVINALDLRRELEAQGVTFSSSTDSEVIARLMVSAPGHDWLDRITYCMRRLQGAYSLVALTKDALIGIRDPMGVRPLCLGRLNDSGWIIASETCALDHVGAGFVREVEPGEVVIITEDGLKSREWEGGGRHAICVFEHIYFSRPDSVIQGKLLYQVRQRMGAQLAREHPVEADLVIGIPDSATAAATGYSQESRIPYAEGLMKNRYIGRTFIQPDQRLRELGVKLKFNPLPQVVNGKRLVVVDDSIVRGTTTPHVVGLLRKAGAKEVHLRVCAPPIKWPCYFGVDMATKRELIAAYKDVSQIREAVGADSLGFLSIPGLLKALGLPQDKFCLACLNGDYPIPVQLEMDKLVLETH